MKTLWLSFFINKETSLNEPLLLEVIYIHSAYASNNISHGDIERPHQGPAEHKNFFTRGIFSFQTKKKKKASTKIIRNKFRIMILTVLNFEKFYITRIYKIVGRCQILITYKFLLITINLTRIQIPKTHQIYEL